MKKILFLFFVLTSFSNSMPLDSNVFQYFPLKTGNYWIWYRSTFTAPGPGYETMKIIGVTNANNHLYYNAVYNVYIMNGNLYNSGIQNIRIDSTTGNLYYYDSQNNNECLFDSLNAQKGDSSRNCMAGGWWRCDTGSYTIFGNSKKSKSFGWTDYFEHGGSRVYAKDFGRVYWGSTGPFNFTTTQLRGCMINGQVYGDTVRYVGVNNISNEIPKHFSLSQNYPNPFNPTTNIKFQIPKSGFVKLIIFDVLGKEVQTLVNEQLSAGTYNADFEGSSLPSGVYYYKLETVSFTQTKKMVLIK